MKQLLILAFSVVFFAFSAFATEDGARSFAESTSNKAAAILASDASDGSKLSQLENLFVSTVDTDWIARFVIGRHWKQMDAATQKQYLKKYKSYLVKHYTSNFNEYTEGTTHEVTRVSPVKKNEYRVMMKIKRPVGSPIKVDYRVREKNNNYNIIDIAVEGLALLRTQRDEFGSVINKHGLDYFLNKLDAKS